LSALEDLHHASFVEGLSFFAAARVGDLGGDDVAVDRPTVFADGDIKVFVALGVARLDEAEG
jgi:hypothetical protein